MQHDGVPCLVYASGRGRADSPPMGMLKQWEIARYWSDREESPFEMNFDRPACFACGIGGGSQGWRRFDRAHLVPRGLNPNDEASNVVLLCSTCHQDAPDCIDPSYILYFISKRERYADLVASAVEKAIAETGSASLPNSATMRESFESATATLVSDFVVHTNTGRRMSYAFLHSVAHRALTKTLIEYGRRAQLAGRDDSLLNGFDLKVALVEFVSEFAGAAVIDRVRAGLEAAKLEGRVGGRKPKLTPEQVALARRLRVEGQTVNAICSVLGVSRPTVYKALAA